MSTTADARFIHDYVERALEPEHEPAWYMAQAALGEWQRVVAWHARRHFDTGRPYSWLEALRATAQNPPRFDQVWDDLAAEDAAAAWPC